MAEHVAATFTTQISVCKIEILHTISYATLFWIAPNDWSDQIDISIDYKLVMSQGYRSFFNREI